MADTGFEKGGGTLTRNFQINGFWPEFCIKKVKFVGKREGRAPPRAPPFSPLNPTLAFWWRTLYLFILLKMIELGQKVPSYSFKI